MQPHTITIDLQQQEPFAVELSGELYFGTEDQARLMDVTANNVFIVFADGRLRTYYDVALPNAVQNFNSGAVITPVYVAPPITAAPTPVQGPQATTGPSQGTVSEASAQHGVACLVFALAALLQL